jgi:hypothetical protein
MDEANEMPHGIGKYGKNIFALQIRVIIQYLFMTHSGTKEFQNGLDWIAQPTNRWLAMANVRIHGDALNQSVHS